MNEEKIDGYISKISIPINGQMKTYKLKCEIVEIHPMTCPHCGAPVELHFGTGKCLYCGSHYSSNFIIEEN